MSRVPMMTVAAGILVLAATMAPASMKGVKDCSLQELVGPITVGRQDGKPVELVQSIIDQVRQWELGRVLAPWQACAGRVSAGVGQGVQMALGALESTGVDVARGNSLLSQTVALVHQVSGRPVETSTATLVAQTPVRFNLGDSMTWPSFRGESDTAASVKF